MDWTTTLGYSTTLGKIARLPLQLIPKSRVTTVRRGCNRGYRWIVGSGSHGMWLGTYEKDMQALISDCVKPGMVAWDVGAHAGFYTLAMSRLVGRSGRVCAFEPYATNVSRLLRHISLNHISNAMVVQAAMNDRPELVDFIEGQTSTTGRIRSGAIRYGVLTISADEFVRDNSDLTPHCIKIDVEGAELAVLEGAANLLERVQPIVILALHGSSQADRCLELLRRHGYVVRQLKGPSVCEELSRGEIFALPQNAPIPAAVIDNSIELSETHEPEFVAG